MEPPQVGFAPPSYTSTPMQPPQQNVIISNVAFGNEPQHMTCPHCQANISTRIDTEANTKTHLFALLLCVLGCWCCAPCPYCMDSCMVKKHYCPACNAYLGSSDN
ncbi:hypothetical protein HN011_000545 [Eciton burchellii]|nr:hypothetical protein HN011_000545 [Eciton burchellii]